MNYLTVIFVAMLAITASLHIWLAQRQRASALRYRDSVPEAFQSRIMLADHQKAADYTAARARLEQVETLIGTLLVLVWTLGGGLNTLAGLWLESGWSELAAGTGLIISAFAIMGLIDIPLDAYRTFILEARFGFNHTSLALYISDALKQGLLLLVLGTPLIILLLWLVAHAGPGWWLYGWLVWMGFTSAMLWLYPTVIAPLFNRFTPLQDAALREHIERLLERCGYSSGGIYVMDGSHRSSHGNAYFTGFGANKRIVFYDTLLKNLGVDEVEAVLAHELGHFKHGHVRKRLLVVAVTSLAAFAILGMAITSPWFYHGLGMEHSANAGGFLLFLLVMPYFTSLFQPLTSHWMRKHEFEADDYAAKQTNAQYLIDALVKLYEENAATLTPDRLYSAYYDSHPPAPVRIAHLAARKTPS